MKTPRATPLVTKPVLLAEFMEAAEKIDNQEAINHPNIMITIKEKNAHQKVNL
jgi:hypothetical protein